MEADQSVAPIVAVVVTHQPGPWFEEALSSLGAQDYPNLSILIVDAASHPDPTDRVASVLPHAYVRNLDQPVPFGVGANEAIDLVEGAAYYLLCHDDVVFAPDAVRLMAAEAGRLNAGIITPKLVDWQHPDKLSAVGLTSDRVGVTHGLVEPGELDQEQHDLVRDVFVAPGAVSLVRADLFSDLGGFDPRIADEGEDLDFCWRAHLAGARISVAPSARVGHLQARTNGLRSGADDTSVPGSRREGHRLRTLARCYSAASLLTLMPRAILFVLIGALGSLLSGRPGVAASRIRSLFGAFASPGDLRTGRHAAQGLRQVSDHRLHRLQSRGSAQWMAWLSNRMQGPNSGLNTAVAGTLGSEDDDEFWERGHHEHQRHHHLQPVLQRGAEEMWLAPEGEFADVEIEAPVATVAAGEERAPLRRRVPTESTEPPAPVIGQGSWRWTLGLLVVAVAVLWIGSRSLLDHHIPGIAQIPETSGGPAAWLHQWWTSWQPAGLGRVGSGAPAMALLWLAGVICFGAVGTLQHILVLGPLIVGPIGAYRATRGWGSHRGRLAAAVAYLVVPLPYDALGKGHWFGVLAYGAAPWMIGLFARLSDVQPFARVNPKHLAPRVVLIGLVTAVIMAFVPSWGFVILITGAGLALGSLLVGQVPAAARLLAIGVAAWVVSLVLLLPWSAGTLTSRAAITGLRSGAASSESFASLLRLHTGPVASSWLTWGLIVAAALPLVLGRGWRLAWAARMWSLTGVCVLWAWLGMRGDVPAPIPEVVLAPAAAALACSVALGVVAFEIDLPGYRFGWRQGASALAALGVVLAVIPVLGALGSGRWDLPKQGSATVLGGPESADGGNFRMLWVGDPVALPMASTSLGGGLAYATTWNGGPKVANLWVSGTPTGTTTVRGDLALVEGNLTTRVGHLLAPLGVRYLVVPSGTAPAGQGGSRTPLPQSLLQGLAAQTDLVPVTADPNYTVYENSAWVPARAAVSLPGTWSAAGKSGLAGLQALQGIDLSSGKPVLASSNQTRATGTVTGGTDILVAQAYNSGWRLKVDGRSLAPAKAPGDVMTFTVPAGVDGRASLQAPSDTLGAVGRVIILLLWLLAVVAVAGDRWIRQRRGEHETVDPAWFVPAGGETRTRTSALPTAPAGMESEELWGQ